MKEAIRLYQTGLSIEAIADALHICTTQVKLYLNLIR